MTDSRSSAEARPPAGHSAWRRRLDRIVESANTPRVALVIGALLAGLATWLATDVVEQASERLIADSADRVLDRLAEELVEYDSLVKVSSHMVASTSIDPLDGIRGYLVGNTLASYYPATTYLSFIRRIPQRALEDYRNAMRSQLNTDENGISSLELRPSGNTAEHLFVESTSNLSRTAPGRGTDIAADPILMHAIHLARATNNTVLLATSAAEGGFPLPALLAPIFNPISRNADDAFLGVLVMGIDLPRLVGRAILASDSGKWAVRIAALSADDSPAGGANPHMELFSSAEAGPGRQRHASIERFATFGNRTLSLEVTLLDAQPIGAHLRFLPFAAFLSATLIVMLSVLLLRRMQEARNRAEVLAQRRQVEAQRSEERFRALVESSSDWIWELDSRYCFTYVSPTTLTLLGRTADELLGQPIDIVGRDSPADLMFPFDRAEPAAYVGFQRDMLRADGGILTFESSGAVIRDPDGRFAGMRGIDRDITERNAIREKLAKLNEDLAVSMRANLVSQLLSGLAHELNQPLSAIAAYNQACLRLLQQASPDIAEVRAAMHSTASHALLAGEIINGLRRVTARREPTAERVRIEALLQNAVRLLEHRIKEAGIVLNMEIAAGLPQAWADPILLTQVCLNLLNNAIDAVATAPRRQIGVKAGMIDGRTMEISVQDTGPGLSDTEARRVFEAHYTTKREGMGLGLPISRSIMEALHGDLAYRANPTGGSIFVITLPADLAAAPPDAAAASPGTVPAQYSI